MKHVFLAHTKMTIMDYTFRPEVLNCVHALENHWMMRIREG